ncbi:adenosine-specific kinase, partial [Thermus scotoductus]|uniref:adenosine-specific kinase n=1 Tax=Thermus scotoductus TaxID=37636 RepID=UPI00264860FE
MEQPEHLHVILSHPHFIKTVYDLPAPFVTSLPFINFGLAFSYASLTPLVTPPATPPPLTHRRAGSADPRGQPRPARGRIAHHTASRPGTQHREPPTTPLASKPARLLQKRH